MKAVITGANGTVGTALRQRLTQQGHSYVTWDRNQVPIDDYWQMETFLKAEKPDVLFHLAVASNPTGLENENWLVSYHWPSELAWLTRELGIQFVFTSTVMVFTDNAKGPFTVDSVPDVTEGYGYDKLVAEKQILYQNPKAIIARLGWQIGQTPDSNNMIRYFHQQMDEQGKIEASQKWLPACSFLPDTADALIALTEMPAGLYLVNSNIDWNFYQIASALNVKHGNPWQVVATGNFVYDQRMLDSRVPIASLDKRLDGLG